MNGREQEIFYTNVAFRGLPVPAGRHKVVMRFAPTILSYSAAVSAIAWVGWLAVLFVRKGKGQSGEAA